MTLDGYFEGTESWNLDFHNTIWGPELEKLSLEQLNSADCLAFGRKTYEGMAAYWKNEKGEIADFMNSIPKLAFSRTLQSVDWNNTTLIKENASDEIAKRKAGAQKDIYVFGSANLSETFINDNLFDEYRIGIAPILLGNGRPLFEKGISQQKLGLASMLQLSNSGMVLIYRPAEKGN